MAEAAGPTATLTYFKGRGRAESLRWTLAACGVAFTNAPLLEPEDLDALRASGKSATGQVPLLEYDGLNFVQSAATIRYLARHVGGLHGPPPRDELQVDTVMDTVIDFTNKATVTYPIASNLPPATDGTPARDVYLATILHPNLAKYLPIFEGFITANSASDTFTVGGAMTIADVLLAEAMLTPTEILGGSEFLGAYPGLLKLTKAVWESPKIAAYLSSAEHYPLPGADYKANVDHVLRR